MKRFVVMAVFTVLSSSALGAFAHPPHPSLWSNPGNWTESFHSDNCVAYYSTPWIHNGTSSTVGTGAAHGHRGLEIQLQQQWCGAHA